MPTLQELGNLDNNELFDFISKNGKVKEITILKKKSIYKEEKESENYE